jgi:hypothetical protein
MRCLRWLVLLSCGCLTVGAIAGERTWTDVMGRTMQAEFLREVDGEVTFLKDGKLVSIPLTTLSEADRQVVRDLAAGKPAPDGPAASPPVSSSAPVSSPPAASGTDKPPAAENKKPLPIVNRTWTDRFGNQVTAKFVRMFGNRVVLQRATQNLTVPFYDFTSEDQDYLRELLTSRGMEAQIPPPPPPPVDFAEGNPGPADPSPQNSVPRSGPPPNFPSFSPPSFGPGSSFHEEMRQKAEQHRQEFQQRIEQQRQEREQREAEARQKYQEELDRRRQQEEEARQNQTVGECLSCKGKLTRAQTEGASCPHCGVAWQFEVDSFGLRRPILNHAPASNAAASSTATSNSGSDGGALSTPVAIDPETRVMATRIIVIGVVIVGVVGMVAVVVFVAITIAAASGAKRQRHYS